MRRCPECKETGCIVTERRPNGDLRCTQCGYKDATLYFDQPRDSYKDLEAKLKVAVDGIEAMQMATSIHDDANRACRVINKECTVLLEKIKAK